MDHEFVVSPVLECRIPGPLKGWDSVDYVDVRVTDVSCRWRHWWVRGRSDEKRIVKMAIRFKNGIVYDGQAVYFGQPSKQQPNNVLILTSIYSALKAFSKRASILPA